METQSQYLRMTREANTFNNMTSPFDDPETMLMESGDAPPFDAKVFWCVNGFIFIMFSAVMLWCCFADKTWLTRDRGRLADIEYQQSLAERQRQRELAKVDSPEKRTRKLLQSFERHKVQMTVREQDLIDEDPSHLLGRDDDNDGGDDANDDDLEASSQCSVENSGQLKLGNEKLAPNCCVICLTGYAVGDKVVWSSNQQCQHAFHQDCVVGWLVKMQPETPCPCCRQEFTDLEKDREERKVVWSGAAFDWHRIGI